MTGYLKKWLERRRVRRAIRLRRRLVGLYGRSQTYSVGQVRRAADYAGFSTQSCNWAYAIHCSKPDFVAADGVGDYATLRQRVQDHMRGDAVGFSAREGLRNSDFGSLGAGSTGGFDSGGGVDGGGDGARGD